MDELFEKLKNLIAEKLEVEEDKITLDARFREDLGADSLDTYELLYAIDSEMGVSVPDEKATEFEKVSDALDFIKTELGK
ncbi:MULTISPECIES: acyl carrier protein [unclassified Oceanispirochaeta]|uniref:acyl carrier protein n=1 Tax=unclassified Oceanispirochaeta TaxID=2635722 RepID=UPI000E09BCB6|nr:MULTISPECIES: acyl carrier protein [unclassified Oceanispirochaeta]MBF9016109.1 acyl carrier protein [Oceanispirochaeta sp. M2]NPD72572.1 acyl carrier protein [Oceanispirochaeta sp. M1]RDG32027.1 acyl carrier protein [Oceanispirochaeta sp. M1]